MLPFTSAFVIWSRAITAIATATIAPQLHLELRDDLVAANAGRFVLRVRDGAATIERGWAALEPGQRLGRAAGRRQVDRVVGVATPRVQHRRVIAGRGRQQPRGQRERLRVLRDRRLALVEHRRVDLGRVRQSDVGGSAQFVGEPRRRTPED